MTPDAAPETGNGLTRQIAATIAEQIISGELAAGERIPEIRLTRELNVSRSSVREALLLLERSHLIQIFPRRGAVVTSLTSRQIHDLFDTISCQLQAVLERFSEQWRQTDLIQMEQVSAALAHEAEQGDFEQFFYQVFQFLGHCHHTLDNVYWTEHYQQLLPSLRRCYFLTLTASRRELIEAQTLFELVMEAVRIRRPEQAGLFMVNFCQHVRNLVLQSLARIRQVELAWARRVRQ